SSWDGGPGDGRLQEPYGVTTDPLGNVYVCDTGHSRIQKFTSNGTFITRWGTDGGGTDQLVSPTGIATDADANVYVADVGNNRIQKFSSDGVHITSWRVLGVFYL